jgi:hypothetical protein
MSDADPKPSPESPQESTCLMEASMRRGWLMADLAIRHLEAVGILPPKEKRGEKPIPMSLGIMMELSAALCLSAWEDAGLCQLMAEDISSAYEAMNESVARLTADPHALDLIDGLPPFMQKLYEIWTTRFAWSSLDDLKADVFLDRAESDEDSILNVMAEFFWSYRNLTHDQTGS